MTSEKIIATVRAAVEAIDNPRFFESERGYQGQLLVQLHGRLDLQNPAVIEQEYQKQQGRHGLTIRPDIILHEPFDERVHPGRDFGNLAVIELKLRGSKLQAEADFQSLAQMINVLKYPLGIFINIDSRHTFIDLISGVVHGRVVAFAVRLVDGKVQVLQEQS